MNTIQDAGVPERQSIGADPIQRITAEAFGALHAQALAAPTIQDADSLGEGIFSVEQPYDPNLPLSGEITLLIKHPLWTARIVRNYTNPEAVLEISYTDHVIDGSMVARYPRTAEDGSERVRGTPNKLLGLKNQYVRNLRQLIQGSTAPAATS